MKAVILAGGEGTRLRPLTSNQAKPMMPLVNRPMMEHIVALLAHHGFDDVVVTVAYLANQIRTYFGDGSDFGLRIRYASDEQPLGTAGSVRNASAELDDTFLVISGDVLTDIDLSGLVKAHRDSGAVASIGLKRVENPLEFGIVITRPDGSIERFLEKPSWGEVFSDTINTGIYVLEPEIFDFIPEGEVVDFAGHVFPDALERGLPLHGHVADGYWEDVGTTEAYRRAHVDVLDGRVHVDIGGFQVADGVWLGENAELDPDARVDGPVVIGDSCRVEAAAHLGEYTVLGTDVVVREDASIVRSVLHDHVYVGRGAGLRGAVVGRSSDLREHTRLDEGVVVGDECFVGHHAVVSAGVKIYPFKTVDADAVVNSSIIWETRGVRTLFGRRGISGLANVDITAEVAVRVAMAYGTAVKRRAVVTASRDTSRVARGLKRAVIGGLNLAGVTVDDVELATVPLTRFQVRNSQALGGITVRLVAGDPDSVELRFFDADGRDIDAAMQRKIERLLHREDYRRAFAGDIGDIVYPPRAIEFYTAALEGCVDAARLREHAAKVVIDYSFGAASTVLPTVLGKLGAEVLAVNPYASTAAVTAAEPDAQRARVGELVRASGSQLGFVVDAAGETGTVVDDSGHPLTNTQALLALLRLVVEVDPAARVALPVSTTREAARIVEAGGGQVVWTKLAAADLMEVASGAGIRFAGTSGGGFIWPAFLPAFDAVATLAHLLDLLETTGRRLSTIVDGLPSVHVVHDSVPTPWERKGALMRELVERPPAGEVVLIDGVKVVGSDGWTLLVPDPEEPVTHVWAEADTETAALRLARERTEAVEELLR
ncbi:MAG TPA: sugar phosphate nucleotidyltransferase [Acidimicrobiia bacterium]|nr:sugar phosphate nucleotidyltransferase [Acidimicrobiia bacterium]